MYCLVCGEPTEIRDSLGDAFALDGSPREYDDEDALTVCSGCVDRHLEEWITHLCRKKQREKENTDASTPGLGREPSAS